MSIERYFLINQLMDFLILSVAARGLGVFRLRCVYAGSLLAAAFALLPGRCQTMTAQIGLLALLSGMVLSGSTPQRTLKGAAALTICAIAAGALAGLTKPQEGFCIRVAVGAVSGAALAFAFVRLRQSDGAGRLVSIAIDGAGRTVLFEAVVDTGNRLREPLSGQPVLIVGADRAGPIMPGSGYRRVAYSSVGGGGCLRCFKPDGIHILNNGKTRPGPEVWVAVYPRRLPGGISALAPAEFALHGKA